MKSIFNVMKEQVKHAYLIRRLSFYETKNKNHHNYLGSLWELLNPLIQLVIYWFVFQSIRSRSEMTLPSGTEVPFVYWLIAGFVLWIFFYKATIEGSNSIYKRIKMISKMNFPVSIIPNVAIFSNFYVHLMVLVIAIVAFQIGGFYINVYYLQFFYLLPVTILFIYAISLVTSTLSTIVRDFHMFLNSFLRMFLYLSPVLWEIGNLDGIIGKIAKLNPLYYLIEGYRSALFGTEWYVFTHWQYTVYFLILTFLLLWIGSSIHVKFRRHFIDYV